MGTRRLTGTVSGKIQWENYTVEYTVYVSGEEYYRAGRMYMSNGDPGYPDEYETEGPFYEDVSEVCILDAEGNQLKDDYDIYEANKEVIDLAIIRDLENNKEWDDCSWDEPGPDEPDEPEREDD